VATITLVERGCRGCTLCVDVCPVQVFDFDAAADRAVASREQDCIGCLSCEYACPSRCIDVADVERLRPFHRIESHTALVDRFLQQKSAGRILTHDDLEEAFRDTVARLRALADAVVETMGRGHKPVGRRAGAVAASHMPEMYEEKGLEKIVVGMKRQFRRSFEFEHRIRDDEVEMTFSPCALYRVVTEAGENAGSAILCELFHEYWAGLFTAYTGVTYRCEVPTAGETCEMRLTVARR
jgi:NAD-dependent dihydropyrimidine dehydrogenase PreA subunit